MNPIAAVSWAAGELDSSAEARHLVAFVLDVEPSQLAWANDLAAEQLARLQALVAARRAGEPLQYLCGRAYFRTASVAVEPGVFIPRPETEVMVQWALDTVRGPAVVVELCAGSGAISKALAVEASGWTIHAVELSEVAYRVAQANLADTAVDLRCGDMADAFTELDGKVDLVIANPPYIPLDMFEGVPVEVRDHEPPLALFSGPDGLDAMRVVARVAARLLKPGGVVAAEHAEVQRDSVQRVFLDAGDFTTIRDHDDLTGRPRFVTAKRR